jgi:hypothetical protein
MVFISSANDLKEQFRPRLGKGDVSQFIKEEQMKSLQLFLQTLEPSFLPTFY